MTKKYINIAIGYAVVAMVFGVFYREFTKFLNFKGTTSLSLMHTHYFMLGMFFFLILVVLEKNFHFSNNNKVKNNILIYQIGLNITGLGFLIRGLVQVLDVEVSTGINAAISGFAGIGHTLLGVSIILILLKVRKSLAD